MQDNLQINQTTFLVWWKNSLRVALMKNHDIYMKTKHNILVQSVTWKTTTFTEYNDP